MNKVTVCATKVFPSGAWEVAAIVDGYRVAKVYFGYSRREAIRLYLEEVTK